MRYLLLGVSAYDKLDRKDFKLSPKNQAGVFLGFATFRNGTSETAPLRISTQCQKMSTPTLDQPNVSSTRLIAWLQLRSWDAWAWTRAWAWSISLSLKPDHLEAWSISSIIKLNLSLQLLNQQAWSSFIKMGKICSWKSVSEKWIEESVDLREIKKMCRRMYGGYKTGGITTQYYTSNSRPPSSI